MAKESSTAAILARTINDIMSKIRAVSDRLGADCASTLRGKDLKTARVALLPVFKLSESLVARAPVELHEALVYLCKGKLCDLLVSLLRRWPWAEMRLAHASLNEGLDLLTDVLGSLYVFLSAAGNVRSSQQASAYDKMSKRCPSEARLRALGCAGEGA